MAIGIAEISTHFLYIAKSKEEVIANSKKLQEYLKYKEMRGGDIWINEVTGLVRDFYFENLAKFDITVSVRRKD